MARYTFTFIVMLMKTTRCPALPAETYCLGYATKFSRTCQSMAVIFRCWGV